MNCCDGDHRMGEWTHDSMNIANQRGTSIGYYRSRDSNQMIYLSLLSGHLNPPTGEFCCVLQDSYGTERTRCLTLGM